MATIDLGKIKFNWRGTFSSSDTYEKDDVVFYPPSSWVYVNATNKTGSAAGVPSASNSAHWDLMADGANPMTTQGDIVTHNGSQSVRLPRGSAGQTLVVSGNNVAWGSPDQANVSANKYLQPNYDRVITATTGTAYGASGQRAWLADYANNWIPECGIPNPQMGPVMFDNGNHYCGYRSVCYLNENHEVIKWGTDSYQWNSFSSGNKHKGGYSVPINPENGTLEEGEYFVRLWVEYSSIWCLTNKGSVFFAGYNGYGEGGLGHTTQMHGLTKIPQFGPGRTHAGTGTRVIGVHVIGGGNGYPNYHRVFFIDEQYRLWAMGYGGNGVLGHGATSNTSLPVLISNVGNVTMIKSGYLGTMLSNTNRELYVMGYNANGWMGGPTISTNHTSPIQVTGVNNVYQFNVTTQVYYTSGWTYVGTAHYLTTAGNLFGSGYAGIGFLGDGTTTQKNAWTAIGGATTYSSIYYVGDNSRDMSMHALDGTPNSPGNTTWVWGYNGTGALGTGNTTQANAPINPSTTTLYSNTTTSTDATAASPQTALVYPGTSIAKIYVVRGINGQSTANVYHEDTEGRLWKFGYNSGMNYYRSSTGNTTLNNVRLDWGPWAQTDATTANYHWAGETQKRIVEMTGCGYTYASEGIQLAWMSDGTIMGCGYNAVGQLDEGDSFVESWIQIN